MPRTPRNNGSTIGLEVEAERTLGVVSGIRTDASASVGIDAFLGNNKANGYIDPDNRAGGLSAGIGSSRRGLGGEVGVNAQFNKNGSINSIGGNISGSVLGFGGGVSGSSAGDASISGQAYGIKVEVARDSEGNVTLQTCFGAGIFEACTTFSRDNGDPQNTEGSIKAPTINFGAGHSRRPSRPNANQISPNDTNNRNNRKKPKPNPPQADKPKSSSRPKSDKPNKPKTDKKPQLDTKKKPVGFGKKPVIVRKKKPPLEPAKKKPNINLKKKEPINLKKKPGIDLKKKPGINLKKKPGIDLKKKPGIDLKKKKPIDPSPINLKKPITPKPPSPSRPPKTPKPPAPAPQPKPPKTPLPPKPTPTPRPSPWPRPTPPKPLSDSKKCGTFEWIAIATGGHSHPAAAYPYSQAVAGYNQIQNAAYESEIGRYTAESDTIYGAGEWKTVVLKSKNWPAEDVFVSVIDSSYSAPRVFPVALWSWSQYASVTATASVTISYEVTIFCRNEVGITEATNSRAEGLTFVTTEPWVRHSRAAKQNSSYSGLTLPECTPSPIPPPPTPTPPTSTPPRPRLPNQPTKIKPMDCCKEIKEIHKYLGISKMKKDKFKIAKAFMVAGGIGNQECEDYYQVTQSLFRMLANGLIINPITKPLGNDWQLVNATAWASQMYEMMAESMSDGNSTQKYEIASIMQLAQLMSTLAETARKVEFIIDAIGYEPGLDAESVTIPFTIYEGHKGFGKSEPKKIDISRAKTDNDVEAVLAKMLQPSAIPITKWVFKPDSIPLTRILNGM